MKWLLSAVICASSALAQAPASAPSSVASTVTLKGVVKNPDGQPLGAVEIVVDSTYRDITNAAGEFSISGLRSGILELTARRVGYTPISTLVQADSGLIVQLAVKLVPTAAELATVVVEGKRLNRSLLENGYYKREKLGMGYFLSPDYLEKHRYGLAALIRNVPAIQVTRTRRNQEIALGRTGNRLCVLSVFIDGNFASWASDLGLDNLANRDDVLAIEVYPHPTDVPLRYLGSRNSSTSCGAILIWTKPFDPTSKK